MATTPGSDDRRSMILASRALRESRKRGLPGSYDALKLAVETGEKGGVPPYMPPSLRQNVSISGPGPCRGPARDTETDPETGPGQLTDAGIATGTAGAFGAEHIQHLLLETPEADRSAMIGRLYRAFEAQVDGMEARLKELMGEAGEAGLADIDRTAKTLASLARTLSLLLDLKQEADKRAAAAGSKTESDDDGRHDLSPDGLSADQLRAALAERLGRLCPP